MTTCHRGQRSRDGSRLVCLAESGAIAAVSLLTNEYYERRHAIAADKGEAATSRLRARFATRSYDQAVQHVLDTLDAFASKATKPIDTS